MTRTEDQPFSPLVGDILTQMITDTAATTNTLIDSLTLSAETAKAEIRAIRSGINALLDGPWMPTSDAIRGALWPSEAEIYKCRLDPES